MTDEEVDQYVQYYLKGDLRQYGTKEALREATGFAYDELKDQYERMIRDMLVARRVEYHITEDVKVTPAEVTEFFNSLPADSLPEMPERYELSEIVVQPQVSEAERDRVRQQLAELRERVLKARAIQNERFKHSRLVHCNAMMNTKMVRQYCTLDEECDKLLEFTMSKLGLSARAYDRILKVARTIADIEGAHDIQKQHLLEAISYRSLDRNNWAG